MKLTLIGQPSDETRDLLRETVQRASAFPAYMELLDGAGVSIDAAAPLDLLVELPVLTVDVFDRLVDESILQGDDLVDMETSSGTTGPRKRRLISRRDELAETELVARMLRACGLRTDDRVACVDTGPLTLMASLTAALEAAGVAESYCLSIGPDVRTTVMDLRLLDPTVIVTIPSILDRLVRAEHDSTLSLPESLRAVVYAGESLAAPTRVFLEERWGLEVFGYYGASETSALGAECAAHDGIHLYSDANLFELAAEADGSPTGELVITTLTQIALPLVRYPLKDRVLVKDGGCGCGLEFPRVEILGRVDGTVSILGSKFSYEAIASAVRKGLSGPRPIALSIGGDGTETLTVALPAEARGDEAGVLKALRNDESDLGFLVGSRLLSVEVVYEDEAYFPGRKSARIVDNR